VVKGCGPESFRPTAFTPNQFTFTPHHNLHTYCIGGYVSTHTSIVCRMMWAGAVPARTHDHKYTRPPTMSRNCACCSCTSKFWIWSSGVDWNLSWVIIVCFWSGARSTPGFGHSIANQTYSAVCLCLVGGVGRNGTGPHLCTNIPGFGLSSAQVPNS
jgi:hypothetical protein